MWNAEILAMECWASAVYAKEHSKNSENGER